MPTPTRFIVPVLLIIAVLVIGGYLSSHNQTSPPSLDDYNFSSSTVNYLSAETITLPDSKVLKSNKKGYPFITFTSTSTNFSIYTFDDKKLHKVDSNVAENSWVGEGFVGLSPNLLFTSYAVGATSPELKILSNETFAIGTIFKARPDQSVGVVGWAPDSKKLLFFVSEFDPNIIGELGEGEEVPIKNFKYNLFNTDTGQITELPELMKQDSFDSFLDLNHIIFKNSDKLTIFDLKKLKTDDLLYKEKFGFLKDKGALLSSRYLFSQDRDKVIYSILNSNPDPNGTNMDFIFGDLNQKISFPITDSTTFVGAEAISPDGKKVAYQESVKNNGNQPDFILWIYDTITKEKVKMGSELPMKWINDNNLITVDNTAAADSAYYLLNTDTGKSEKIVNRKEGNF